MHTRDFKDLAHGVPHAELRALFDITEKTLTRWLSGQTPAPRTATLYLAARHGDLSALFGPDWEGFYFGLDRQFYHPFFKYGFNPHELKGLFFNRQEVAHLRREVERLKTDLHNEKTAHWAAGQVRELVRPSSLAASAYLASTPKPPPSDSFAGTP